MPQKKNSAGANGAPSRKALPKIEVRRSTIHGRGVFALEPIRKGKRIIEYTGRHLPWKEAMDLPPNNPKDPFHTFFFSLNNGDVIDAAVDGNEARWINHSCDPNCATEEDDDDRIFVYARRKIEPGEELFYDYKIVPAERRTKKLEKDFACFCGTAKCRGTMIDPPVKRKKRKRTKPQ